MNPILQDVLGIAVSIGMAAVPALFAMAVRYMQARHVNTTIVQAVGRAAGLAFLHVQQSGVDLSQPGALHAAVAVGLDYMNKTVPGMLAKVKLTQDVTADMVSGQLGVLVANSKTNNPPATNLGPALGSLTALLTPKENPNA